MCGQRSTLAIFKDGSECTQALLGGGFCPGKFRDQSLKKAVEYMKDMKENPGTPPPIVVPPLPSAEEIVKGMAGTMDRVFDHTEPETKPEGHKIPQLSSKKQEHYTPPNIIEVARKVMGAIHLDPASCEKANTIVKADHFFTKEDDALTRPWAGEVWLNPPGGKVPGTNQSQAQAFFFKAVDEWKAGRVKACCFLGFTLEILRLTQASERPSACEFAFCVLRERTCFLNEDLKPQEDPTHANVLVLISHDKAMIRRFYVEAQKLGAVVVNADLVLS